MKFIITIKDEYGNTFSEHEQLAEPHYITLYDAYEFVFNSFHMMVNRKLLDKYMVRKNDKRR